MVRPEDITHSTRKPVTHPDRGGHGTPVFRSSDVLLNALNGQQRDGMDLEDGTIDDMAISHGDRFPRTSPFDDSYEILHEARRTDNIAEDHIEELMEDEDDLLDLEYDEGGSIYNLTFHELPRHPDSDRETDAVRQNNLEDVGIETGLLTVHTIVYEDPDGAEYLLHWDPGRLTPEDGKEKFYDDQGLPDTSQEMGHTSEDGLFEDYTNQPLEDGLDEIYDSLIDISEDLYDQADTMEWESDATYSDSMETAWEAQRWRAMADAIDTYGESNRDGQRHERPITVSP